MSAQAPFVDEQVGSRMSVTIENPLSPQWPDPPLRSGKVAIVGFADESRYGAPFEDPECEIWGLNMCEGWMLLGRDAGREAPGRLDRMFELHDRATLEQEDATEVRGVKHLPWMRQNRAIPIYMVEQQPDIPMSRRMPIEVLTGYFDPLCEKLARTPYFTSTFAFMILTAIMGIENRRADRHVPEPGEKIWIAGIELLNGEEYAYQRSCAEFFCGVVLGRGIQLEIPSRSALLESDGMYGYAPPEKLEMLVRMKAYYGDLRKQMLQKRDEATTRRLQAMSDYQTHDGVAQGIDRIINHLTYLIRGGKV